MFKEIKGFEELYKVSDTGEVFSLRKNRNLKPKTDKYGYFAVCLRKDGKNYHKTVHRLVADAFIEKPAGKDIVNHIDFNKKNNNVSNLEWTTVQGNTKHAFEHSEEFRTRALRNRDKGTETHSNPCLIKGIKFKTQEEASLYFGVNRKTIYNWLRKGGDATCLL